MRGAWGSEVALPATGTEGLSLGLSDRNRQFREAVPCSTAAKTALKPFRLFDRRVHRRRQGLGVNGLVMVEAAAQHQGRGEDGKGQNSAHKINPPKRDFRLLTLAPLRK